MNKRIKEAVNIVEYAIKNQITVSQASVKKGRSRNFISNFLYYADERVEKSILKQEEVEILKNKLEDYESVKDSFTNQQVSARKKSNKKRIHNELIHLTQSEKEELVYDAYEDEKYDERSKGWSIKNENGKTESYSYRVMIRGEKDLTGSFTREEMDLIYRLYSNMDGAGLTLRSVSRHFSNLTYRDFKRILRAFNITKASIPVAPHVVEEKTEEEVADLVLKHKENNVFKRLEENRSNFFEKSWKDALKELWESKNYREVVKDMLKDINTSDIIPFTIKKEKVDDEQAMVVYLSDQHVGAMTEHNSIYQNEYNEEEFNNRLRKVLEGIKKQSEIFGRFDKIVIANLGDCLDGFNAQTTRGGHILPQNMDNRKQFTVYVDGMLKFFETLYEMNLSNNIDFISVGNDNHSGSFGYIANKTLEYILSEKYPEMNVRVFEKFIEHLSYGKHTFILTHGKDEKDRKHGFPLYLDNKTEIYFNEYLDVHRIDSLMKHVIKGDLHQTSTCYGKRFRYKNVASLYGSSDWIHNNFGYTKPSVDYDIVSKNSEDFFEGKFNII